MDSHSAVFDDLPLKATVRGKASFPFVVLQDVRQVGGGLGASTPQLWKTLGLMGINHELAQPLTKSEVKLNAESSPDLSKLEVHRFRFMPAALHTQSAVVVVQIANPGMLTTSFSLHLPNEREIEVPQWADEGEPSEDQLKENRIIDELKCFEVYPRHGKLRSGETAAIAFTYNYTTLDYDGRHELKVLLRIHQGKQFWLQLEGVTLSNTEPLMFQCVPPVSPSQHVLYPVAVGTTARETPVQETELLNMGYCDITYEIDVDQLAESAAANYGFQSLHLENPVGRIEARTSASLRWRFLPIEIKEYAYELKVTYTGGSVGNLQTRTEIINLLALGYDPRVDNPHNTPLPDIKDGALAPPYQLLDVATQVATLSDERLKLGRLPQRSVRQEVVVIRNLQEVEVDFIWETDHDLVSRGVLKIEPEIGTMSPKGFALVTFTISANCPPCCYQVSLWVLASCSCSSLASISFVDPA